MPYEVRRDGPADKPYCVYKQGERDRIGCHINRVDAERQATAIQVATHSKASTDALMNWLGMETKSIPEPQQLRRALIVTANAYRDRTEEIIQQKALESWVDYAWRDDTFVAGNPLLFWHSGDRIGDIIYAATEGPFLIEVAQERPDYIVNLMPSGEHPIIASVKGIWDAFQEMDIEWGASPEFLHLPKGEDGDYATIMKTESSVLPRAWAANRYTLFTVL